MLAAVRTRRMMPIIKSAVSKADKEKTFFEAVKYKQTLFFYIQI